ncbi:MAG: hypothetical protein ABS86_00275 [Sphingobium sp. SCN 64-10]|nr:MAG: hypothetical protein ABS86_00275 [Sphingobium sp. SCN 64-10]
MPRITIRFKDALFGRLVVGAQAAGTTIPDYVRDILNRYEGMDDARALLLERGLLDPEEVL